MANELLKRDRIIDEYTLIVRQDDDTVGQTRKRCSSIYPQEVEGTSPCRDGCLLLL